MAAIISWNERLQTMKSLIIFSKSTFVTKVFILMLKALMKEIKWCSGRKDLYGSFGEKSSTGPKMRPLAIFCNDNLSFGWN